MSIDLKLKIITIFRSLALDRLCAVKSSFFLCLEEDFDFNDFQIQCRLAAMLGAVCCCRSFRVFRSFLLSLYLIFFFLFFSFLDNFG